jgi:hypothetical protein
MQKEVEKMKEDEWWENLSRKTKKKVMEMWASKLPPLKAPKFER